MSDGFYVGTVKIYFYGIIIMFGVLAAIWLSIREAKLRGLNSETVWDMVPWLLVFGLVGARLWHVFTPSKSLGVGVEYYLSNPIEILNTRKGGLGIPGAVLGGALGLWVFSLRKKLDFLTWADIIAPGLALAQAVGRWGNFINQELYGPPSELPWAINIAPENRLPGYESYETFHPMFLYESIWNLFNCILLLYISRKYEKDLAPGEIFLIYLIVYPSGRFLLEFIRVDPSMLGSFNINQIIMAIVAMISGTIFFIKKYKRKGKREEKSV